MSGSPRALNGAFAGGTPEGLSKDQLVLAMLAVLGGERTDVNERDLFLACWHAFPNAMRWADTALPNPDTFTASLRRLDADELITRTGKQARNKKKATPVRAALEVGRAGVVRTRIRQGALARVQITRERLDLVRSLVPPPDSYRDIDPALLVAICLAARQDDGRTTDEGLLVETAFHKFPDVFAYRHRPEFPDVGAIRSALNAASARGLSEGYALTPRGRLELEEYQGLATLRIDSSTSYKTGAFRLADRLGSSPAYLVYRDTGSLSATKGDELFRALRLPPTTDVHKIATALVNYARELRRIDRGELVEYLFRVAARHNSAVLPLIAIEEQAGTELRPGGDEDVR